MCVSVSVMAVEPQTYDVVVYGGTSPAIIAAVQAVEMGKSVVVVSPDKHLGGLTSGGLGFTDTGNKAVIGGLSRDFYHRVWKQYQREEAWRWQEREAFGNRGQGVPAMDGEYRTMWVFEPHVAERVFEDIVAEFNIPVHREEWLDRGKGVVKEGNRIVSIATLSGTMYQGRMFIDATYEGDLMAAAGVSYHVGRESNTRYGETLNGVQTANAVHHQFDAFVDPYVVPGDPASGLLPRLHDDGPGVDGEGDHRVQAYNYRVCLTTVPENRVPFPKPANYDLMQYELLGRYIDTGYRDMFGKFDLIPNLKTDTNNRGAFSTDNIGMNYEYPEASYERRREILREHEDYQKGYFWYL
ncbi:MAG TPA: FAD-dependent oxidoreductase, partial [Candidatus Hydrogenedentes bacterium]|nr:FAD-dependent oxidoreductase [Candidatus Hydrogenedentota bacterium]